MVSRFDSSGCEQKGYAVSSTIYPVVVIVMSPVATFLYAKVPSGGIFIFGLRKLQQISFVSVAIEMMVQKDDVIGHVESMFSQYFRDIREGFQYVKKEKGILKYLYLYEYCSGASQGVGVITSLLPVLPACRQLRC